MKRYGKINYVDKNWFIVNIQTNKDVESLKEYFGLPTKVTFEWFANSQGIIITGAHLVKDINKCERHVYHYRLEKGCSKIEYVNYK